MPMTIDPTPETAAALYRRISDTLDVVRARLARPLTLSEKIVLGHLVDPQTQELVPGKSFLRLQPDRVVFQDVLGQSGMLQFMQTGRSRVAVPTTIHCDHLIEARTEGTADLAASVDENEEIYGFLRAAAAKYGAGFWGPGAGIIHQVVLENYAYPGTMIIGTDSHTPNGGGLGACAVGVGGADATEVIAGLPWELLYPKRIGVVLTGALSGWTAPKDVILYVAGALTVSGGTNAIIEYVGPGAESISATGKATITNMGAEVGATTSMFPADGRMAAYLSATGRAEIASLALAHRHLLSPDDEVLADPHAHYDQVIELDLSTLEPHVVGPHSPDRARPISMMAAEVADPSNQFVDEISSVLIGSCTNSSYEDMGRAAAVAAQGSARGLITPMPFMVTPGSETVRATIERDGQMQALKELGATVLANACGPCIGQWKRARESTEPNTIVTSYNRNFPARNDGLPATMNFITSPEIATALALAGRLSFNPLTDSLTAADGTQFTLPPPPPADDVPRKGFEDGRAAYIAPPDDGASVRVPIRDDSERLQRIDPWPAWDGSDIAAAPIVFKAKGKTTTDQISPAGPWLKYRGHLGRISDSMFLGVVNAYTDARGRGRNLQTGETDQLFTDIARAYNADGIKWVGIGDANYGEGSSREHAALMPRKHGCAAIIARSFARIHETNLKKQGVLALTFSDPADYDRIRESDRLSIAGIADMQPDQPLPCTVHRDDGTTETLMLRHSYTADQMAWYRAGSALNLIKDAA